MELIASWELEGIKRKCEESNCHLVQTTQFMISKIDS